MVKHSIIALVLLFSLAGCMPMYADPYSQVAAGQAAIRATEAAAADQARQAALEVQALEAQAGATRQAIEAQATATAQALEAQATAAAWQLGATQTAQAWQVEATAQAGATLTAIPPTATARAALIRAERRREQGAVISFIAWQVLKVSAALAVLTLVVIVLRRLPSLLEAVELRKRTVYRGGANPIFAERLKDGRLIVYDPSRLPGAAAILGSGGVDVAGVGVNPDLAAATIARAQAADLARAIPPGWNVTGGSAQGGQPTIEIINPGAQPVAGWLEEVETKLLEGRQ